MQLLLAAILAARCFGSGSSRRTLVLACDDAEAMEAASSSMEEATPPLAGNNRYSFRSTGSRNNYGDYNYKWEHGGNVDGIADSSSSSSSGSTQDNEDNNDNDNYNYNKAPAKWQKQKLYGNPIHSIHDLQQQQQQHLRQQQEEQQQEQQQGQSQEQFDDDPVNARNDFRLQLSDLNEAVPGVGRFVVAQDHGSPNHWLETEEEREQEQEEKRRVEEQFLLARRSRSSSYSRRRADGDEPEAGVEPGQPEYYENEWPAERNDGVDVEGEEDYAVVSDGQEEDANELSAQLPYGIQNVRKRRVRSVMPPPPPFLGPNPSPDGVVTYQSLCPTNRVTVKLESGEYRPNHYVEVTCAHNYAPLPARSHSFEYGYRGNELLRALLSERSEKREICSATGFSCIQLNRTIHLIRLNDASGCWESETRTVPSGCECMWPKHSYGDIAAYHQAQKRRSGALGLRPHPSLNVDYKPGVGYRQLTLRTRSPKAPGPRNRREDLGYESYEFN
ncbi:hypothetical protein KR059_009227 [Drosophila kikkawai]|nr:hypothetical protein KR059_009227 [Drosophila kikkawai]